jgi:ubiquinone/menaquinone biosynthesis C-methylase UbiE
MKPLRDPERAELSHLKSVCDLRGKLVLEIGCGDGVFIRQYQRMAKRVFGIDPAFSELQLTGKKTGSSRLLFLQARGEDLPFASQAFDIAIFASSL